MSNEQTDKCCTSTPQAVQKTAYERVGTTKKTEKGLSYYESAKDVTNHDVVVILVYDIYGPNVPQMNQQVDRVSKTLGIRVIEPDYFGVGTGYPNYVGENLTEEERKAIWNWVMEHGSADKIKERTHDIVETLKSQGVKKIGIFGFCWGGLQSSEVATIPGLFDCAGAIHSRGFDAALGSRMIVPFLNIASKNEPADQSAFYDALPTEELKAKYKFIRYDDVPHGFAAARGKWDTSEAHRMRAEEAMEEVSAFVKKNLIDA